MSGVFQKDVIAIELNEMVSVLTVPKKNLSVKKDDWVMCKKGLYSGDIGQVFSYNDAQQEVVVRLIPRLSLDDNFRDDEEGGGRRIHRKDNRPVSHYCHLEADGLIAACLVRLPQNVLTG
jgi:hypothetical protein